MLSLSGKEWGSRKTRCRVLDAFINLARESLVDRAFHVVGGCTQITKMSDDRDSRINGMPDLASKPGASSSAVGEDGGLMARNPTSHSNKVNDGGLECCCKVRQGMCATNSDKQAIC